MKLRKICAILLALWPPLVAQGSDSIAFLENRSISRTLLIAQLPVKDNSGFSGRWRLKEDIPRYISRYLSAYYKMVSYEKCMAFLKTQNRNWAPPFTSSTQKQNCGNFQLSLLLGGEIEKFFIHKGVAGVGSLGGAKHYLGIVHYRLKIFDPSVDSLVLDEKIQIKKSVPLVRVNYYRLSDDEDQFLRLNETDFGSPLFDSTIAGNIMKDLCKKIDEALLKSLVRNPMSVSAAPPPSPTVYTVKIVGFDESDSNIVYLNAGFKEQIVINEKFDVFSEGEIVKNPENGEILGKKDKKVGELVILFVKADHFCKAKIVQKDTSINTRCYIQISR